MDFVFQARASDAPFVERVWQTRSQRAGSFISTAASQWEMVLMKHRGATQFVVRGPATQARLVSFPAEAEFFGIVFELGTFIPPFPTVDRLNGRDVSLPEAGGASFWLNSAAWQFPAYDNADTFVSRLARDGLLVCDPVVAAVLHEQPPALSPRAVQYRFLRATGLSHKAIQQIHRAQRARELLAGGKPILDTVHAAGYFDQAHLTNSLRRFVGQTPAQITPASPPS